MRCCLKLVRKEKGLTQEQLAEMLAVSRQAVSKWESDNGYPETDKLLEMAKKLEVPLDFLMGNKPSELCETEKTTIAIGENKIVRTCLHKKCVRIFEHNFVADKAKIHRQAVA